MQFCHAVSPEPNTPTLLQLYSTTVLLSGLTSLVLTQSEMATIDHCFLDTMLNLKKLIPKISASFIYLLGGSLPATPLLDLRQLSLFSMIARLPYDVLNKHAKYALTALMPLSKSWFTQVRDICLMYSLPHPLTLLDHPMAIAKEVFKKRAKFCVVDYWEKN